MNDTIMHLIERKLLKIIKKHQILINLNLLVNATSTGTYWWVVQHSVKLILQELNLFASTGARFAVLTLMCTILTFISAILTFKCTIFNCNVHVHQQSSTILHLSLTCFPKGSIYKKYRILVLLLRAVLLFQTTGIQFLQVKTENGMYILTLINRVDVIGTWVLRLYALLIFSYRV